MLQCRFIDFDFIQDYPCSDVDESMKKAAMDFILDSKEYRENYADSASLRLEESMFSSYIDEARLPDGYDDFFDENGKLIRADAPAIRQPRNAPCKINGYA